MRPPQQKPVMPRLRGVALARSLGKGDGRVEIGHHLRVRHLRDDLGDDLLHVGDVGDAALPGIELRGDRHVALLGEAAAHIADVLVHAEDLLHDQDDGECALLCRPGAIGRNLPVGRGDAHLSGFKPFAVRVDDGLSRDGAHGGSEPDREARGEHFTTVDVELGSQTAPIALETVHALNPQETLPMGVCNRTFMRGW